MNSPLVSGAGCSGKSRKPAPRLLPASLAASLLFYGNNRERRDSCGWCTGRSRLASPKVRYPLRRGPIVAEWGERMQDNRRYPTHRGPEILTGRRRGLLIMENTIKLCVRCTIIAAVYPARCSVKPMLVSSPTTTGVRAGTVSWMPILRKLVHLAGAQRIPFLRLNLEGTCFEEK
jgi:hypothetical protein